MSDAKQLNLAPFTGVHHSLHEIIERLLRDIYHDGEWSDEHDDLLAAWRAARGDDAKDAWWWWAGEIGGESYSYDAATRDEVIAIGLREYAGEGRFQIIEARMWRDTVMDGEDVMPFAETRNGEVILIEADGRDAA